MRMVVIVMLLLSMGSICARGEIITVDDDGPADFATIQAAIDYSWDGDTIIVQPGLYTENVDFNGKEILITNINPDDMAMVKSTVIDGFVTFQFGENQNSILEGFAVNKRICVSYSAPYIRKNFIKTPGSQSIYLYNAGGIIKNNIILEGNPKIEIVNYLYRNNIYIINNTLYDNLNGIAIKRTTPLDVIEIKNNIIFTQNGVIVDEDGLSGTVHMDYNCFWHWSLNAVDGIMPGEHDFIQRPNFVDVGPVFDLHQKSEYGRWDTATQQWVYDDVTSRCIDAGDPADDVGLEPNPNGGRINIGAYGGTPTASKSTTEGAEPCINPPAYDTNNDCIMNMLDIQTILADWLNCGFADPNDC